MRRLRCWLVGHRLVWDRHPVIDRDAARFTLYCPACRRGLDQVDITHTLLVTRADAAAFTKRELWKRTLPHLALLFRWPPAV